MPFPACLISCTRLALPLFTASSGTYISEAHGCLAPMQCHSSHAIPHHGLISPYTGHPLHGGRCLVAYRCLDRFRPSHLTATFSLTYMGPCCGYIFVCIELSIPFRHSFHAHFCHFSASATINFHFISLSCNRFLFYPCMHSLFISTHCHLRQLFSGAPSDITFGHAYCTVR